MNDNADSAAALENTHAEYSNVADHSFHQRITSILPVPVGAISINSGLAGLQIVQDTDPGADDTAQIVTIPWAQLNDVVRAFINHHKEHVVVAGGAPSIWPE